MKKIAIIGTAGVPARYGGFETLAENLIAELASEVDITVYCSSASSRSKVAQHNGARLRYVSFKPNGAQSVPYDILSLFHAARTSQTILILGVSGCVVLPVFRWAFPGKILIINIDGLEHRRSKWSRPIQWFLKYSERLAVKYGDVIVADNDEIQRYINEEYGMNAQCIAYGGDHVSTVPLTIEVRQQYNLPEHYAFKVCRIEPENNVNLILDAFVACRVPLVVVGNWNDSHYGRASKLKYGRLSNIRLIDAIYHQKTLDQIRSNCSIYVHGHSAGGTNPSLVEAMTLGLPVVAFDVPYNRATTMGQAFYFTDGDSLREIIENTSGEQYLTNSKAMLAIARDRYTWKKIAGAYRALLA
jgi:glycosyltransferase involved in cell wall biosynthesis